MEREHTVDGTMKEALQNCLANQDVVPLISRTVEWDLDDDDNGHHGFVLRHEYEDGLTYTRGVLVHIGNCFDTDTLRAALNRKTKMSAYPSLDALLADWRVD